MRRRTAMVLLIGTVAALGTAPAAWASKIGVDADGVLRLRAGSGERNDVRLTTRSAVPQTWTATDAAGIKARQGCTQVGPTEATCPAVAGRNVEIHLGDKNDKATAVNDQGDPVEGVDIYGDSGHDELHNSTVYAAYVNGGRGDDVITVNALGGSVEVEGGSGDDSISNREDASSLILDGGRGDDTIDDSQNPFPIFSFGWIIGGPGNDTLLGSSRSESIFAGRGNDVIIGSPKGLGDADRLDCGRGRDRYATHIGDFVRRNCERAFTAPQT